MLSSIVLISAMIINLGYNFEGSFTPLGEFHFHSTLFSGTQSDPDRQHLLGNRFSATRLESLPVPLPVNYLLGIDAQRWDFERTMPSYLCGVWQQGGWWYYYLYALVVKLPLGTWLLLLVAIGVSVFAKAYRAPWPDEMVLLLPAIAILMMVSSQTGFSIHSRYVLPLLPYVFVWVSKVGRCVLLQQWPVAVLTAVAVCWSVGSSLWYYPHSLSYFNELAGGPTGGHAHLLDSNIAWDRISTF